jgi:hypothetical protein
VCVQSHRNLYHNRVSARTPSNVACARPAGWTGRLQSGGVQCLAPCKPVGSLAPASPTGDPAASCPTRSILRRRTRPSPRRERTSSPLIRHKVARSQLTTASRPRGTRSLPHFASKHSRLFHLTFQSAQTRDYMARLRVSTGLESRGQLLSRSGRCQTPTVTSRHVGTSPPIYISATPLSSGTCRGPRQTLCHSAGDAWPALGQLSESCEPPPPGRKSASPSAPRDH